jgi:cytochrome c
VNVTAQYVREGTPSSGAASVHETGRRLIEGSDCLSCHQLTRKSIGPAYVDVAQKYKDSTSATTARLVRKIREGGSGVWGNVAMPAHPALTDEQAPAMLAYIMSLANRPTSGPSLPVRGTYVPPTGSGDSPTGVTVLRASYTDRGANGMPAITKEKEVVLHSPTVVVASGELSDGVQKRTDTELPGQDIAVVSRSGSFVKLKQLDLTGVGAVVFSVLAPSRYQSAGGKVEVRLDSATGSQVGESELIRSTGEPVLTPFRLRTALKPTSGVHDVYLVFRNPDAKGDQFLFAVLTATFEGSPRSGAP